MVYCPVYPFAQTVLLTNVCGNRSLVWFAASHFCYIFNTGSSPGLFLAVQLLRCAMELLQLWFCRAGPLPMLRPFLDGEYVVVGQFKVVDLELSGSQVYEASHSPMPVPLVSALPLCPGEGQYQLSRTVPAKGGASSQHPHFQVQFSHTARVGRGPAHQLSSLLHCPSEG